MTFYKENTRDQIMRVSVPSASGISYAFINAGNIQNTFLSAILTSGTRCP